MRRRSGMTLIEIMAVLAILGIIASIVTVTVVGALDDAAVEATRIKMGQVKQGLELYYGKNRKYPTTGEGLAAAKKYLPNGEVPTDDWGNEFQYFSPGTSSDKPYEIVSLGKDGKEGGEEANADIKSWEP